MSAAVVTVLKRARELVARWFKRCDPERCGVDGEVYNMGRGEGRADVAVRLRRIVDPGDAHHWNLDGTLTEVQRLVDEAIRREERAP